MEIITDPGKTSELIPCPPDFLLLTAKLQIMTVTFDHFDQNLRYINIEAKNQKANPSWHNEAGEKSWLFVDEIVCNK